MSATRAEIDAQRAIAAKAWEEGARWRRFSFDRKDVAEMKRCAAQWAAEQHPYPTVTRPRVVRLASGWRYKIENGVTLYQAPGGPWLESDDCQEGGLMALASLLTEAQLDEVRRGPCGPTETVEAE